MVFFVIRCLNGADYPLPILPVVHLLHSVAHAQQLATQWLWKYINERPHPGIGGVPPRRFLMAA